MGADVNAKAFNGGTPLHGAQDAQIVKILVSSGADINVKCTSDGRTPLHFSIDNKNTDVAIALINNGADVNIRADDDLTPYQCAIMYGEVEIVESCLSHGADVNTIDSFGFTPLHHAVGSIRTSNGRHYEMAKLLVTKGAKVDISFVNKKGESCTPLDIAKGIQDLQMVQYLSSIGAK